MTEDKLTTTEGERMAEFRDWLMQPPPRAKNMVAILTAPTRRRTNVAWMLGLALLVGGIVGICFGPLGGGQIRLLFPIGVTACGLGGLGLTMALYYRSHRVVFEDLVRQGTLTTAEVDEITKGARGGERMQVFFERADGVPVKMNIDPGHVFTQLCDEGDALLCLYAPRKYGAVLLPNGELALGTWQRR